MPTYPTMEEARAAGLFHCNCRHGTHAYLPGITDPMVGTEDPKGYEDAKKLRYLERKVREKKRMEAAAFTPEAKARAVKSLEDYRAKIRLHVDETGIRRQRWRESFGVSKKQLSSKLPKYPQGPVAGWSSELHTAVEEWTSGVDYADTRNAVGALVRGEAIPDTVAGRRAKVLFESMQSSPRYTGELSRSLHSLTPAQMDELTKVGSVHDLPLSSFSAKRDLSHQYLELQDARKDSLSAEIVVEPTPGGVHALTLTPGHGMSTQYTTEVLSSGRFEVKSVKQMYGAKGHYQPYKQITMRPVTAIVSSTPKLARRFDDVAIAKLKRDMAKVSPAKAEEMLMAHMDEVMEEAGGNSVVALNRLEYLFAGKRKRAGSMLTKDVKSFVDGDDLPLQSVPELSKAAGWLDKYVNPSAFAGKGGVGVPSIRIDPGGRPYCNTDLKQLVLNFDSSEGTILHELAHLSFQRDKGVQDVVKAQFSRRISSDTVKQIAGLSPGEIGYRDKFIDHYAGRIYSNTKFPPGTELLSMGLEYMNVDPVTLYQKDPDLFKLTLAWMRGAI